MRPARLAWAVILAGLAATAAPASASTFATAGGCLEHEAFVTGDDAQVEARLPARYAPVRQSGRPLLFFRAVRCDAIGGAGPATMAMYGILVESPDGSGCASAVPVLSTVKPDFPPACNLYTLGWMADRPHLARWLRDDFDGFPVIHTQSLSFALDPADPATGAAAFRFRSPAFAIDAVGRERPREIKIRRGYLVDTPAETLRLAFSSDSLIAGDGDGTVSAAPGSDAAALMGATEQRYAQPYGAFAAERFARGVFRKQHLGTTGLSDRFDGSCSVQGDVTFDPPATNTPTPGGYAYDGKGTCSGTLNGRAVTDVAVRQQQAGRAQVACTQAYTLEPGRGTLTFADGTRIGYTIDFTTNQTEVDGDFYGDRSGRAPVHGTFATPRTPPDVTERCRNEGVVKTPLDLSYTTETPLVSDRPAPRGRGRDAEGGPAPEGARPRRGARRRLRVTVTPRRVRAGRRTAFRVRVRPAVAGAIVRIGNRRARTGPRGRARIVTTLRRRGRRVVRVAKLGYRSGRTAVVVRR